MYKLLYLPTSDQIFFDGCTVINHKGQHFIYDETQAWDKAGLRVAQLMIVENEFNEQIVIGIPSLVALRWVKAGMEIKAVDCKLNSTAAVPGYPYPDVHYNVFSISCPTCNHVH